MSGLPEELLNAKVVFGLKNQGHLQTIEKMLAEGKNWRDIAHEIGWMPDAARKHYEMHCWEKGTWQHDVLPILAGAIGKLLELAQNPENQWHRNEIMSLALQAREHLKGSTKTSDYYPKDLK